MSKLPLTHWGRVTHINVSKLTTIGSEHGLFPGWCQAIIWTNAGILLIGPLGTNFSEVLNKIYTFSFKKMQLKMSSAKWPLFRLGLNELRSSWPSYGVPICGLVLWIFFIVAERFHHYNSQRLSLVIPKLAHIPFAEQLAEQLLQLEPRKRISAKASMRHQYFDDLPQKIHELSDGKSMNNS